MKTRHSLLLGLSATALLALVARAAIDSTRTWTFDNETTGLIAKGFTNEVGEWKVEPSDTGNALAQRAKNADSVFNITLASDTSAKDLDLSVRVKALAGKADQGGGLVWRARDAKNYYLARYNPLEDNYRAYKVVGGHRTMLKSADIPHSAGWCTLRITMKGDHIECFYDGKKSLEADDATFPDAGKVGLWSKADAQSHFDDLKLTGQ
jgi:hypothetical protein